MRILMDVLLLFPMRGGPTIIPFETMGVILAAPGVDTQVEKLRVCIHLTNISNPGCIHHSKAHDPTLEGSAMELLRRREGTGFLGHI